MQRRRLTAVLLCFVGGTVICLICWWIDGKHGQSHPGSPPVATLSRAGQSAATPAAAHVRPEQADQPVETTDTALETARQEAKDARQLAKKTAKFWAALNARDVKVPGNFDEDAIVYGRSLANIYQFDAKWGDRVPLAGTPEATEYRRTMRN